MRLNFLTHRRLYGNIRRVANAVAANLDKEIALEDLAEVANLSPAHMVRIYSRCVGEAPIATLRRLRLQRAFDLIGRGRGGRFTDVALDAGYASSAAFNHAFRKQFGIAPRDVPSILRPAVVEEPLCVEYLPERKVWQLPYEGVYGQNGWFKSNLVWQCHAAGRGDLLAWRLNDRDNPFSEDAAVHVRLAHFIPADALDGALDAELVTLPGGFYAVTGETPTARPTLLAQMAVRVREELGCQLIDGPTLDREPRERCFLVPQERRAIAYLPVLPVSVLGRQLCERAEIAAKRKFRSNQVPCSRA